MMTLQSKVEMKLEKLASKIPGREVIASYAFGNLGTYHLLEDDVHIRQLDFRFTKNNVSLDSREEHDCYYELSFDIGKDWDKLMKYLSEFVKANGQDWSKLKKYIEG